MKNPELKQSIALILILSMFTGFAYSTVVGPNGVSDLLQVYATALDIGSIFINDYDYTDNLVNGGVNDSVVSVDLVNSSVVYTDTLYIGEQHIDDYISDAFFSPDIPTPVVEKGATLPLNTTSRKGQLFYLTTTHKMYYFNSTHWVGVGGVVADVPGGGQTVNATGRVTVVGEQIYDANGDPLYLAGAVFTTHWNIASSTPDGLGTRIEMFNLSKSSGANFIVFGLNSELWYSATYRSNIDTFVTWAVENDLFFVFKIQALGNPTAQLFSGPGSNYKIALPANVAVKNRAIGMWEDLVTSYASTTGFVGLSLLNEPYSGNNYDYWDIVDQYYYDSIDAVTAIDPACIFFVMEPRGWGSDTVHWQTRGYVDRPNVVYEYHLYYDNWWDRPGTWGELFYEGNEVGGQTKLEQHYQTYVLPAQDDGYPIYCGEFGPVADSEDAGTPINNWETMTIAFMDTMYSLDIHYTQWHHNANNQNYALEDSTGRVLSEKGEVWRDNLPAGLITP